MKFTRKCENCIWVDQCAQEVACEDYCPASQDELEEIQCDEFNSDLKDRHEYYHEQIEEQNS